MSMTKQFWQQQQRDEDDDFDAYEQEEPKPLSAKERIMSNEDPFNDTTPDPADDFFSGGSPPCKFETIGTMHAGTIESYEEAQQRDISTGEPKCWPDGNKAMMLVITLQTTEYDANVEDDDGKRRLYVNKPSGMMAAIKKAVGKNKFRPGGVLKIKYVKNGKAKQAGFNPPKEYEARYIPVGAAAAANGNGAAAAPEQPYPRTRETVGAAAPASNPFEGKPAEFTEGDFPF